MGKLVDREEVIESLREYITEPDISDDESEIKGYNDGIDLAISLLSEFPSTLDIVRCKNCRYYGFMFRNTISENGQCFGWAGHVFPVAHNDYCSKGVKR